MSGTHDYACTEVTTREMNDTHVLVGESGGLSAVYEVEAGEFSVNGWVHGYRVETEHGVFFADSSEAWTVLAQ